MAKPKKPKQFRRVCCFCKEGNLTKEHIFAEWMHPLLPDFEKTFYERKILTEIVEQRERQGSVKSERPRVVCGTCNNEWMSLLEVAARPILEPIVRGEARTLKPDDQRLLATYFFLKAIIVDQNRPSTEMYDQEIRTVFLGARAIPSSVQVNMYRYFSGSDPVIGQINKNSVHVMQNLPLGGREETNVGTITFRFDSAFVQVIRFSYNSMVVPIYQEACVRLHPTSGLPLSWPPATQLSQAQANQIQFYYREVWSKNAIRFAG